MGLAIFLKGGREARLENYCLPSGFCLQRVNMVWAYGHAGSEFEHSSPAFLVKAWKRSFLE